MSFLFQTSARKPTTRTTDRERQAGLRALRLPAGCLLPLLPALALPRHSARSVVVRAPASNSVSLRAHALNESEQTKETKQSFLFCRPRCLLYALHPRRRTIETLERNVTILHAVFIQVHAN